MARTKKESQAEPVSTEAIISDKEQSEINTAETIDTELIVGEPVSTEAIISDKEQSEIDTAETIDTELIVGERVSTEAEKKQEDAVRKRIYVGASVPGFKTSTVFEGEDIPAVLDVDFVRDLCIDIEKLGEFYKKKAVTDSREAFCYRKSAEYAKSLKG